MSEVNNPMFKFSELWSWTSNAALGLEKQTNKQGPVKSYLLKLPLSVFGSKNEGCPPGTQYGFAIIWVEAQMISSAWQMMTSPIAMGEKDNLVSC